MSAQLADKINTNGQKNKQYAILSLAGSQNLCQTIRRENNPHSLSESLISGDHQGRVVHHCSPCYSIRFALLFSVFIISLSPIVFTCVCILLALCIINLEFCPWILEIPTMSILLESTVWTMTLLIVLPVDRYFRC